MKYLKILLLSLLIVAGVAVAFFVFEELLHLATELVWHEWLHTDEQRLLIVPLIASLTLLYFWLQHVLDRPAEGHESHGLDADPTKNTLRRFGIILLVGFFALLTGASLGPEAVLLPACFVIGGMVAQKAFGPKDKLAFAAAASAAVVALFAAFFDSFFSESSRHCSLAKLPKYRLALACGSSLSRQVLARLVHSSLSSHRKSFCRHRQAATILT